MKPMLRQWRNPNYGITKVDVSVSSVDPLQFAVCSCGKEFLQEVSGAKLTEANLHAFERIFNQISTDANCMDEATKQASEALQKRDRGRSW